MILKSSTAIALLLTMTSTAWAFDCSKASTAVEETICANPDIKAADDALAAAYAEVKASSAPAEQKMLVRARRSDGLPRARAARKPRQASRLVFAMKQPSGCGC